MPGAISLSRAGPILSGPAALLLFNFAIMLVNSTSVTGLQNTVFGTVNVQYFW